MLLLTSIQHGGIRVSKLNVLEKLSPLSLRGAAARAHIAGTWARKFVCLGFFFGGGGGGAEEGVLVAE